MMHEIRIRVNATHGTNGVWVDGMQLQATHFRLCADAETGVPILHLSLVVGSVDVDANGSVVIDFEGSSLDD